MAGFKNLTQTNGFDYSNLNNARQNNYAWSISELGEYIYVGTGRNILLNIINSLQPNTNIPLLINAYPKDNLAEIWRYRKDGTLTWELVYKAKAYSQIFGFRFMINHRPFEGSPCIYAAAYGEKVQVLKTTNGVDWCILPDTDKVLQGTSSRAMVTHRGKLYLATVNELGLNSSPTPLLYSSKDPEFYPWNSVIDTSAKGFDPKKNPKGAISNMAIFNDRLYVATSNADGVQVWRTNREEPQLNDWTLVVDKGFGNTANKYSLGIGVFKDHLYVSGTKQLPLAWLIPMGCDIVRIDKNDNWSLVVGGNPLIPLTLAEEEASKSLSGLGSGFNNPFNVYAWQIQEYQGKLFIGTFDDSSNMEVILDTLLANKLPLEQIISAPITNGLIEIYKNVVKILREIRYPIGFDLYMSEDGINFSAVTKRGLRSSHNYGARLLYVDSYNELYLGTANPFQGCEVYKLRDVEDLILQPCDKNHYKSLWKAKEIINKNYSTISKYIKTILGKWFSP